MKILYKYLLSFLFDMSKVGSGDPFSSFYPSSAMHKNTGRQ